MEKTVKPTKTLSVDHLRELSTEMIQRDFEIFIFRKKLFCVMTPVEFYSNGDNFASVKRVMELAFGTPFNLISYPLKKSILWCNLEIAKNFPHTGACMEKVKRDSTAWADIIFSVSGIEQDQSKVSTFFKGFHKAFPHIFVDGIKASAMASVGRAS
ncbi:MAG: hypothetical protein OXB88_03810 [Bacteriovoracales bacterium]|nr:hypothetical protein [Bacteriovoracales bacterium]